MSQSRRPRVFSCLAVAVLFPLTARAGEQASAASENDAPVVVNPAGAEAASPAASPAVAREGEQAPATGDNDSPIVVTPRADAGASALAPAPPTEALEGDETLATGSGDTEAATVTPSTPHLALDPELGGDGRRTLGRFATNLGRNVIGVFSPDNLGPLFIGAAVAGASSTLDGHTERFFASQRRLQMLGSVGQQMGGKSVVAPLALGLFTVGRASNDSRLRATTYDITQAFIVNALYTSSLKHIAKRTRPDGSDDYSFPSGHTSNAVAWATVVEHHYGPRFGIPAYVAAGLIGASRLEKNVHHLSDVLAGATLGYVIGRTAVREDGQGVGKGRRFVLSPATAPDGTGIGAAVSVLF